MSENSQIRSRLLSTRAERNNRAPYVITACQPCRRRKIKCNGQEPCNRCARDKSRCKYDISSRRLPTTNSNETAYRAAKLSQAEEPMHHLTPQRSSVTGPSTDNPTLLERLPHTVPRPLHPSFEPFRDSLTLNSSLNHAITQLQLRSTITTQGEDLALDTEDTSLMNRSESLVDDLPLFKMLANDPLQTLSLAEAKRLIRVFQNGPGAVNPVAETKCMLSVCERIYDAFEETRTAFSLKTLITAAEQLISPETVTLKLILANASTCDTCGLNKLTAALFESVRKQLGSSYWALPNLLMIQHWMLVAILHFQIDEELQAGRVVAHVARLCLELGINKPAGIQKLNEPDRELAKKLVCNSVILDRRSSIGMDLPYLIPDEDLDVDFTSKDDITLYLRSVFVLAGVVGDVYKLTKRLSRQDTATNVAEIEYTDFRVIQWQNSLPSIFAISQSEWQVPCNLTDLNIRKFVLALRANQLRAHLYKSFLHSSERASNYEHYARTAIQVAENSIHLLSDLNAHNAEIFRTNIILMKYFLISAFSVLMLAVANFPDPNIQDTLLNQNPLSIREGFNKAIDLFYSLKNLSPMMASLWESVQKLRSLAVRSGKLPEANTNQFYHQTVDSGAQILPAQTADWQRPSFEERYTMSQGMTTGFTNAPEVYEGIQRPQCYAFDASDVFDANTQLENELNGLLDDLGNPLFPEYLDPMLYPL